MRVELQISRREKYQLQAIKFALTHTFHTIQYIQHERQ